MQAASDRGFERSALVRLLSQSLEAILSCNPLPKTKTKHVIAHVYTLHLII